MRTVCVLTAVAVAVICCAGPSFAQSSRPVVPTRGIGHAESVQLLAISGNGEVLASADNHSVKLWQMSRRRVLRTLEPPPHPPGSGDPEAPAPDSFTALAITADGRTVVAGDNSGRLHKWDAETGRLLMSVAAHNRVRDVEVTPDGRTVVSIGSDFDRTETIGVASWSLEDLRRVAFSELHAQHIAVVPDGTSALVTMGDKSSLLSLPDLRVLRDLPAVGESIELGMEDLGRAALVARGSNDGSGEVVTRLDLTTGTLTTVMQDAPKVDGSGTIVIGPRSQFLLSHAERRPPVDRGDQPGTGPAFESVVEIWTPAAGGRSNRVRLAHPLRSIGAVAFTADGTQVVISDDNRIGIWDTRTGVSVDALEGPMTVKSLAISADGQRAYAVDGEGIVSTWRLSEGEIDRPPAKADPKLLLGLETRTQPEQSSFDFAVEATARQAEFPGASLLPPPDWTGIGFVAEPIDPGRVFAVVSTDGRTIALWDPWRAVLSGQLRLPSALGRPAEVQLFSGASAGVVMLPGKPGEFSDTAFLWDFAAQRIRWTVKAPRGKEFASARLSPDGASVVLAVNNTVQRFGVGGAVQLRRADDGRLVKEIPAVQELLKERNIESSDLAAIDDARISPGGRFLVLDTVRFERFGRRIYATSSGKVVEAFTEDGHWLHRRLHFFRGDTRVVETLSNTSRSLRLTLRDGVGTGSTTLLDLPLTSTLFNNDEPVLFAADGKEERLAVADGADLIGIDLANATVHRFEAGHLGLITAIRFTPDGKRIVTGSADGTVRVWDVAKSALLVTFVGGRDGQWIATTPSGFHAASDRPGRLMSVVRGLEAYSIEQFYGPLYRPDLVKEWLSGDAWGRYKNARAELNLESVLDQGDAPNIELLDQQCAGHSIQLKIRLSNNSSGGIGKRLIWRVNGAAEGGLEPPELQGDLDPFTPKIVTEGFPLDFRRPGGNRISVVAFTAAKEQANALASVPLEVEVDRDCGITSSDGPARPRMHVLAIGVDTYPKLGREQLKLAVKDVVALRDALIEVGRHGGYEPGLILSRTQDSASPQRIEDAFRELSGQVRQQDVFVLLLAGHGLAVDGVYYYFPVTADVGNGRTYESEGIATEKWQSWVAMVHADKKLIVVDTCQSNAAVTIDRGTDSMQETVVDRLRQSIGRTVLTAARDTAFESGSLQHGLMTYAILEVLGSPRPNGEDIDVQTLSAEIGPKVEILSRQLGQKPQLTFNRVTGNFPLGLPLAALAPPPLDAGAARPPDYVVKVEAAAHGSADSNSPVNETLPEGALVTFVETKGDWVLVAQHGVRVGWVDKLSLLKLIP